MSVATDLHRNAPRARPAGRPRIEFQKLGVVPYDTAYDAMRRFTESRDAGTPDELWLLQHPPIYTVGVSGRPEHLPSKADIPIRNVDRGGQITYHGPGQAIVYALVDLARRGIKVRNMVTLLEQAAVDLLDAHGVAAARRPGAPGVYVNGAKIAALGLRVRRGCCYHGIALNADMDLTPFSAIDPCGYPGLDVTQASALGVGLSPEELGIALAQRIARLLGEARGPDR